MINASTVSQIDLSLLPPPDAVEQISFERIYQDMRADFVARCPEYNNLSEADPVAKLLQACAYRETLLRQRENNKVRSLLLAFATGADLDHIGVTYFNGTQRLVIQTAQPQAVPPIAAALESDDDYRRRLLLQPEGESVAGPEGAYVFHTLSAHPDVSDASAYSPWPAGVVITVLARGGETPSAQVLACVADRLKASDILPTAQVAVPASTAAASLRLDNSGGLRPVGDRVFVRPATLVRYEIAADVFIPPGPDSSIIAKAIAANIGAYKDAPRRLGRDVARSAIDAAVHVAGVERVVLTQPAQDILLDISQASVCTGIRIRINGEEVSL